MNKTIFYSTILTVFFTGCSSKLPSIYNDEPKHDLIAEQKEYKVYKPTEKVTQFKQEEIDNNHIENKNQEMEIIDSIGPVVKEKSDVISSKGIESIYFDFNQFSIREDMESVIEQNIHLMKNKKIKLEGNCDEFGTDEYNVALGLKRANAVKTELVNKGIPSWNISMISYGESNQVCSDKTEECFAKNRRVDFVIK